jgi:hypothetical protein
MYQHRAFRFGPLASHHDHRRMKAAFAAAFRHDGWDQRPWPPIPQRGSIGVMNTAAQQPSGSPGKPALEERVHRLEAQMQALVEAVEVLARGLENGPMAEPRNRHTEEAARRAHELLLLAKSAPPARADKS